MENIVLLLFWFCFPNYLGQTHRKVNPFKSWPGLKPAKPVRIWLQMLKIQNSFIEFRIWVLLAWKLISEPWNYCQWVQSLKLTWNDTQHEGSVMIGSGVIYPSGLHPLPSAIFKMTPTPLNIDFRPKLPILIVLRIKFST